MDSSSRQSLIHRSRPPRSEKSRGQQAQKKNKRQTLLHVYIGEKKTFREIAEIVHIAKEANAIMIDMLSEHERAKLAIKNQEVKLLEKKSDEIAFRVKEHITSGAVSPAILDNLLKCVDVADTIIDDYYFASRELCRIANAEFDKGVGEHPELDSAFMRMLELATNTLGSLEKLLTETDLRKVARERLEIEHVEEEGDDIKDNALDRLYALAPEMHFLQFTHYSELLYKFDSILDGCEDLSDLIVSVMTSISR